MSDSEDIKRLVDEALRACMADTPREHPDYEEIQRRLKDHTPIIDTMDRHHTHAGDCKGDEP
jgi:hypothetical protein